MFASCRAWWTIRASWPWCGRRWGGSGPGCRERNSGGRCKVYLPPQARDWRTAVLRKTRRENHRSPSKSSGDRRSPKRDAGEPPFSNTRSWRTTILQEPLLERGGSPGPCLGNARSHVAAPRFEGADIHERIREKTVGERRYSGRVMAALQASILKNRGSPITGLGVVSSTLPCIQVTQAPPGTPLAVHEPGRRERVPLAQRHSWTASARWGLRLRPRLRLRPPPRLRLRPRLRCAPRCFRTRGWG